MPVKMREHFIEIIQVLCREHILPYCIAKLEECTECTNDFLRKMAFNCWQVYLKMLEREPPVAKEARTFINAFESLPVHCLKCRPCGKRRRPGKGGTIAILEVLTSVLRIYGAL